jgi:LPXTG-motif cell wall-anchored protein
MPRARRVAIALSAVALTLPSAALAQGTSGAGDDQYNDPFENSSSGSGQSTSGSQTGSGGETLTQNPNLGGGQTSSGTSTGTAAPTLSGTSTALPNTGSDPRLLILAGLALLLSGLGLRLRTADEIF